MKTSVFFLLLSFFFCIEKGRASGCYDTFVDISCEVVVEGESVFLVAKSIDNNEISISDYLKKKLPISPKEARFVARYERYLAIVANADYYYVVSIYDKEEKEQPFPFLKAKRVSEIFGNSMFRIDGKWKWVSIDYYHREIKTKSVKNFPDKAEMLHNFGNDNFLLKNNNSLVIFDEINQKVTPIVGLNVEKVRFEKGKYRTDTSFIFDEYSCYGIELNGEYFDMTEEFKKLGLKDKKFTDAHWIRDFSENILLDFQDGDLWACDEKRELMKFYLLKNSTYYPQSGLIFYNDHYYSGETDLSLYKGKGLDVSAVKNLAQLRLGLGGYDFLYYDDSQVYIETRERAIHTVKMSEETQKLLFTKYHRDHSGSYVKEMDNILYFYSLSEDSWNSKTFDFIIEEKIPLKTSIKQLTMGFLFNDILLIENQMVKNIGNRDTMLFVGSTVDVIRWCDTEDGRFVEVSYHYFYKDDQAVYHYNEDNKEMKKLPFNPKNFDEEAMCAYFFKNKK